MRHDGSKLWVLVGLSFPWYPTQPYGHGKAVTSICSGAANERRGTLAASVSFVSAFAGGNGDCRHDSGVSCAAWHVSVS
jgi:hypothetical protein